MLWQADKHRIDMFDLQASCAPLERLEVREAEAVKLL